MPSADQILNGLREITNTWQAVAIFWHVYFGALILAFVAGVRPSKWIAGLLLGFPLLSVSAVAWLSSNPFNGIIFAALGILFLLVAVKLSRDDIHAAFPWYFIPGAFLFGFGWIYPHFLEAPIYIAYLYSTPTGIIPCPTLSIVIGSLLMLDGLGSRKLCIILGVAGLYYGATGFAQLHVLIDSVLVIGAIVIVICAFMAKWAAPANNQIGET